MAALTVLRRLAEQHSYSSLREACLDADPLDPGVQVLLALAEVHLGDGSAARRRLASIHGERLEVAARLDLAAAHMALGEWERSVAILEATQREVAPEAAGDRAALLARLAGCRLQQGRCGEALALYERSLALQPSLAAYLNLLRLYRDEGRLADMDGCLRAAWAFWSKEWEEWPEHQRRVHSQQLRCLQLDLWLALERFDAAEAWVEVERDVAGEADWCDLVCGLAERLAARDRHAQAEEWLRVGLRGCPEHRAFWLQLADLAHLQGRAQHAVALLRRAIELAEARDAATELLWIRLSSMALPWNGALAREAVERARHRLATRAGPNPGAAGEMGAQPHDLGELTLRVELALAEVEAHEGDRQGAERRFRQALEQQPRMVDALHGLGQLLLQVGRLDEAVALFERAKAVDPVRGHGALFHARRFPDDEDTLDRLERLARTPSAEGSVHAGLLFQLAAAWEKREDYERAFALAAEGNAAVRRLLCYDPRAHRQRCARIRHAFSRALYDHRPGSGHESDLPVFVVGMPRSGTTLVEQMMAGHSRIHGAGELGTIPRVIAGLERWERRTGSGRGYPDCVDDLDPAVARGVAEDLLNELRDLAPDAAHVVDKLPHNFENIGLIKLLFPRAKIVSVRRDPRDVAVSNYFLDFASKHGAMGFAYDLEWIGEQLADHNLLMHHWQRLFPGEILEIRYEDVVDDPEASARRMLDYIGVGWEPQVLRFDALERPVRTASVWQVRQPLYTSSKGRWRPHRRHLKPLIAGTNRRITWDPIEMVTLPEPGWLNIGVDHYRRGDLDAAEYRFELLLRHLPEHAAARFMLGLICLCKGHRGDGISLMEQAVERCPWNRHWRSELVRAYRLDGRGQDAASVDDGRGIEAAFHREGHGGEKPGACLDYLFLSGEAT